jgi:hypothetical protein
MREQKMSKIKTFLTWVGIVAVAIAITLVLPSSATLLAHAPGIGTLFAVGVTFNKHNAFVENLAEKVHNLGADALTYAITNTVPTPANSILGDLTQISYTNMSSRVPTISSSLQSSGTYKLVLADLVMSMSGGASPSLRYFDLYNDTPTSPADPLIGWWDYGSSIVLADGEQITADADPTNGVLQLA